MKVLEAANEKQSRRANQGKQKTLPKQWSDAELTELKRLYRKVSPPEIARRLGVNENQVYYQIKKHKHRWGAGSKFPSRACIESAIREMHPQGFSDTEITDLIRRKNPGKLIQRHRVSKVRRGMGLPSNQYSERGRREQAKRLRRLLKRNGHKRFCDMRQAIRDEVKQRLGYPSTLSLRAVQAAELLRKHGPMTRFHLAAITGRKGGSTYLAELQRLGIVDRLLKAVPKKPGDSPQKWADLYFLTNGASG